MAAILYPPTQDFLQKTLASQLLTATTSAATLSDTTGVQNEKGVLIIDRIDANGVETPTKVEVISFGGTSGATVTTLGRGLAGTSASDHAVGAIVEFGPDAIWAQAWIDTFVAEHSKTGVHGSGLVTTLKASAANVTTGTSDTTIATPLALGGLDTKTSTYTNKRITRRAPSVTQSATPTINTDVTDVAHITGLAQAITSMTTNLSGTPVEGDTLRIDITDDGTARTITWGTSFESSGNVTLPTTTVLGVRLDVGFVWNTVTSKWRCVATS